MTCGFEIFTSFTLQYTHILQYNYTEDARNNNLKTPWVIELNYALKRHCPFFVNINDIRYIKLISRKKYTRKKII